MGFDTSSFRTLPDLILHTDFHDSYVIMFPGMWYIVRILDHGLEIRPPRWPLSPIFDLNTLDKFTQKISLRIRREPFWGKIFKFWLAGEQEDTHLRFPTLLCRNAHFYMVFCTLNPIFWDYSSWWDPQPEFSLVTLSKNRVFWQNKSETLTFTK